MSEKQHRYGDVEKAAALNAFLKADGDLTGCVRILENSEREGKIERVPSRPTLEKWRNAYGWPMFLQEMRNRLVRQATDDAIEAKQRDLHFINIVKTRLIQEVEGEKDEQGNYIKAPLQSKTLDTAAVALTKILETEMKIKGEDKTVDAGENLLLELLKHAMDDANAEESKSGSGDALNTTAALSDTDESTSQRH